MDVLTQHSRAAKAGSVFEAVTLISITMMLIGLYLYSSGSRSGAWVVVFAILTVIGIAGSIVASYRVVGEGQSVDENTEFRINAQLVQTLKTKQMFEDVVFGLENVIKNGDVCIKGKRDFLRVLEATFGTERAREVDVMILKYAAVPDPKAY
jgi:hypothetical protein